ncbi:interferon-inducible GTPase-domain-containing protein [Phlebopus sp. FC_14]|nr:interferon-inducible GTPase-domain-containing protein [Phlebopus sp. FC_14]
MGAAVSVVTWLVPIATAVLSLLGAIRTDHVHENPTLENIQDMGATQRLVETAQRAAQAAREEADEAEHDAEEARKREREAVDNAERAAQAMRQMEERTRAERHAADEAKMEAEREGREARAEAERYREALAASQRAEAEARRDAEAIESLALEESRKAKAAQVSAEETLQAAKEKARAARKAQEDAEDRLRKGIQPVVVPSLDDVVKAKKNIEYKDGIFHFAVAGVAGSGKSSLINAFCGRRNKDAGAAPAGVTETTLVVHRYPDPNTQNPFVWYDLPGAGTLNIPDWQYFNTQGLYVFDCIIVVVDNRFTMTDVAILTNCRRFGIPTYIVRSKADSHIRNIMRELGYDSEDEDADEHKARRKALYRAAREQYIAETRASVKRNLKDAKLPDQRVYVIANSTLLSIVKDQVLSEKTMDELELMKDLFSEAHSRRCVPKRMK